MKNCLWFLGFTIFGNTEGLEFLGLMDTSGEVILTF